jgi:hypothetical protein
MAGEINGTNVIIKKGTAGGTVIVGQGSMTHTYGGTLIPIDNKSNGDNITYLEGENAGKQHIFAGTVVYNSDTIFRQVRADVLSGTSDTYTVEYVSDATTDEKFDGTFFPTGMSDDLPHGDKVMTTISFNSSGAVNHTPAVT